MIAKWASKSGKWNVSLESFSGRAYGYQSAGSGGVLYADSDTEAISQVQKMVDIGLFLPDSAKTPMSRVL